MFLRKLRDKFVGKVLVECENTSEAKKSTYFQNNRTIGPCRHNPVSGYEVSGIWNTRDSVLWAWRRVREYLNDWFDLVDGYKEAYTLMRS